MLVITEERACMIALRPATFTHSLLTMIADSRQILLCVSDRRSKKSK